jgi:nucleotide-binding universal stress UspA family protein
VRNDIVVGIDGSPHAERALLWALDEAELRGARVRTVLAWSFTGEGQSVLGMGTTEEDAREALAHVVEAVAGDRAHLVDQVTVNELAVDALLGASHDAALLVVGTRGRGGLAGMLLGSTSRKLVERATIPVVVVPPVQAHPPA